MDDGGERKKVEREEREESLEYDAVETEIKRGREGKKEREGER